MFQALGQWGMALGAAISIFAAGWIVGRLSRPYGESEAFWRGVEHGQSIELYRGKDAPAATVEEWEGRPEPTHDPAKVLQRA
jgi:hypothetical protein